MKRLNEVIVVDGNAIINNNGNAVKINLASIGLAVYGTLRKGDYNYDRFDLSRFYSLQGRETISGLSMQDLGSYPCVFLDETSKEGITVEYYLPKGKESLATAKYIISMEAEAGYKVSAVEKAGNWYLLFYFKSPIEGCIEVEDGDWIKWKEGKAQTDKRAV